MNAESKLNVARVYEVSARGGWEVDDPIAHVAASILNQLREFATTAIGSKLSLTMLESIAPDEREDNHDELVKGLTAGSRIADRLIIVYVQAVRRFAGLAGRDMNAFFLWLKSESDIGRFIETAVAEDEEVLISEIRQVYPNYDPPKIAVFSDALHAIYLDAVADSKK